MIRLAILATIFAVAIGSNFETTDAEDPPFAFTATIRVTVDAINAIDCFDETVGLGCGDADFYFVVGINGDEQTSTRINDDNTADWNPDAVFEKVVPIPSGPVPVFIDVRDFDSGLRFDDAHADIDPTNGGDTFNLDLSVQVAPACSATGDATIPVEQCGKFQASTGTANDDKASIRYKIEVIASDPDGDWLPDFWEIGGLDSDGNPGTGVEVALPAMGANPGRKDLFLEIDCLEETGNHSHCPVQGAVQSIVQAFADAPVNNVDGSTGIQLHVDVGNLFGHALGADTKVLRTGAPAGSTTGTFGNYGGGGSKIDDSDNPIIDWDGATGNPATNFYTLKGANFNSNRALAYRYMIFAHQVNFRAASNDCTSGWAEGGVDSAGVNQPGNDAIVSLGGTNGATPPVACWGTDAGGNSVGSQNQQAGTFMHEFGHNLSLDHGGNQGANNKPHYLSVMNYGISTGPASTPNNVQMCNAPAVGGLPGGCDYSRIALPSLNEMSPPGLDECAGIGLGLGGADWDGAGGVTGGTSCAPSTSNVSADINGDSTNTNLTGFEDWNSIRYDFRTDSTFSDGSPPPTTAEPDPQSIADARAFLAELLKPELSVDKTGPSDAVPGDTLNYSIDVESKGSGPALSVDLTDTKPDATTTVFDLGTATVGAKFNRSVTYAVPCATNDATVLTNTAAAAGTDLIGNPVSASDSVQTTIHAPVLTLAKTATSAVNAGQAITYTLVYSNTGSGDASSVSISDTLPADVYYSLALDSGMGPKPTSVAFNANGTRTLTWTIGGVAKNSGPFSIQYTARPTLLALGGTQLTNDAALTFTNANGCTYAAVSASASTSITVVTPSQNPGTIGFWGEHPELWSSELRARIQATDQRYDGIDGSTPDGALSSAEVTYMFLSGGNQPKVLQMQLLATYFNLADRRINAGTLIRSKTAERLGLTNVRDAALFAISTLPLPVTNATKTQYSNASTVIDEINRNKSPVY
jgi:uncharacterized repeat protein (TIGR01451 family)